MKHHLRLRQRLALLAGLVTVAGALTFAAETPAQAATYTYLQNVDTGGVLDAKSGGTGNWTQVITWDNAGSSNQRWSLDSVGPNLYRIRNEKANRCVDIAHSNTAVVGRELVLWDCSPTNDSQRWSMDGSGNFKLVNQKNTSWCLNGSDRGSSVKVDWCSNRGSTWSQT